MTNIKIVSNKFEVRLVDNGDKLTKWIVFNSLDVKISYAHESESKKPLPQKGQRFF